MPKYTQEIQESIDRRETASVMLTWGAENDELRFGRREFVALLCRFHVSATVVDPAGPSGGWPDIDFTGKLPDVLDLIKYYEDDQNDANALEYLREYGEVIVDELQVRFPMLLPEEREAAKEGLPYFSLQAAKSQDGMRGWQAGDVLCDGDGYYYLVVDPDDVQPAHQAVTYRARRTQTGTKCYRTLIGGKKGRPALMPIAGSRGLVNGLMEVVKDDLRMRGEEVGDLPDQVRYCLGERRDEEPCELSVSYGILESGKFGVKGITLSYK
jgi:hypothetical protein